MLPKRVKELVLSPSQHFLQRCDKVCSFAPFDSFSTMVSYFSVTSKMELIKFSLIIPYTSSFISFMTSSSAQFFVAQIFFLSFSYISIIASFIIFFFQILSPQAFFSKNLRILLIQSRLYFSKTFISTYDGFCFSQEARIFLKSSMHLFSILLDQDRQTKSQLFSISGRPPLLMELQKNWQSSTNMAGEHGFPLKVFFLMFRKTLVLSSLINSKNLGRIQLSLTSDIFCNFFSSSTGLMSMKQSLSLKKLVSSFRMPFFLTTISLDPFCNFSAFQRQSLGVMGLPCSSSSLSAKSLTSQRKVGKQLMISCISLSPPFCSNLLRLVIRLKFWTAFSSMLPTLLQTKQEESSMAMRKIFVSVCSPSSSDPSPSVSITIY